MFGVNKTISKFCDLRGKTAIITGAAKGMGKAHALKLSGAGAKVVVTDIDVPGCQQVAEEIKKLKGEAIAVKCDQSKKVDVDNVVKETLKKFGKIDILVNNAGIFPFEPFLEMPEENFEKVIDVNLKGYFLMAQACAKEMQKNQPNEKGQKGAIVNISSIAAIVGFAGLAHYCASKGGIIAINLKDTDELVDVKITDGNKVLIIESDLGRTVRFNEADVNPVGRNSMGVRGISLRGSKVIGMEICDASFLLTITENGYGKRTNIEEYRLISRGGSGVTDIKVNERNGKIAGIKVVNEKDEIIAVTKSGSLIRINISGISEIGRNTQGVRIMKLDPRDKVISIAKVISEEKVKKDFTLGAYK